MKRFVSIILLLCLLLSFSACGGPKELDENTDWGQYISSDVSVDPVTKEKSNVLGVTYYNYYTTIHVKLYPTQPVKFSNFVFNCRLAPDGWDFRDVEKTDNSGYEWSVTLPADGYYSRDFRVSMTFTIVDFGAPNPHFYYTKKSGTIIVD